MIPIMRVNPPNMKKTANEPKASSMIGAIIKQNDDATQLRVVAKGTIFAGIISGTYIQTVGPIVNP